MVGGFTFEATPEAGALTYTGLIAADEGKVTVGASGGFYASADVGTNINVFPVLEGEESGNYRVSSPGTPGEITARPLKVTAGNAAGLDASRPPVADLTYTVESGVTNEGLVAGESADDVLSGELAYGTTANEDGTIPILVGTLAATANYNLEFTAGKLFLSGVLDLDVSGEASGDEGILIARYLLGLRGAALTANLTLENNVTAATLESKLAALVSDGTLDVDGVAGTTHRDGFLIARYLLDVTEAASLVKGVASDADADADAALAAVEALLPPPPAE